MSQTPSPRGPAIVALAVLAYAAGCNRNPGLTPDDAGPPPHSSAPIVVDASTSHSAIVLPRPSIPPASPELTAHLVATSKRAIEMKQLGQEVLFFAAGGPYEIGGDGELAVSGLGAKLVPASDGDISGTWPNDLWLLDAETRGERSHVFYDVSHWEKGRWQAVKVDAELSDVPGVWFDGFTPTSPGTAVALTHGGIDPDAGEPGDDDVLVTITPRGKSVARGVGTLLGEGGESRALLGAPSGDTFVATAALLIRIPPGGREQAISPPSLGADEHATDASTTTVQITTAALAAKGSVVVGLRREAEVERGTEGGGVRGKSAIALLKRGASETIWDTHECPFDEPIASITATPDGAFWVVTKQSHIWRYDHDWERLPISASALREANLVGGFDVALVATAADDAWITVTVGAGHRKAGALFHTKPASSVRHLEAIAGSK